MRLFVAIDLPEEIRRGIQSLYPLQLKSAKELPLSQLHLTLRFIGDADEQALEDIKTALRGLACDALSLKLSGVGVFPNPKRPRILWLGFSQTSSLLKMQDRIEKALQGAGLPAEERPFSPHLTLARFKFAQPREVEAFLQRQKDFQSPEWDVKAFHLYSSLLDPKGAIHKIEETYELR